MITNTEPFSQTVASSVPAAVLQLFDTNSQVELLWLDPHCEDGVYHGVGIRGRAWVDESAARQVVEAVRDAFVDTEEATMCFDPQYAVRLEAKDKVVEVLFCFNCRNAQVIGAGEGDGIYPAGVGPRR
jgi:hypothetical protein